MNEARGPKPCCQLFVLLGRARVAAEVVGDTAAFFVPNIPASVTRTGATVTPHETRSLEHLSLGAKVSATAYICGSDSSPA